jgi:hypothetical protein
MTLNINAQPGDETRRNGDYIGLPHPDGEVRLSNVTLPKGKVVTYDGTDIGEVTGDNNDPVTGVVYEYDVFGDSPDPYVRGDRDATVKTRGAVVADLSKYQTTLTGGVSEGDNLGANGRIEVLEEVENGTNLYEVLVR